VRLLRSAAALAGLLLFVTGAAAQTAPPEVAGELAPTGKLRAAINFGNPVLAQRDPAGGEPRGVSADLARELARRLAVPVEFVTYDNAGKVADAARSGAWDVAFLAIDPVRAADIAYSAPYVLIEGAYLVRESSPIRALEEVDRQGVRIVAALKSAYDLYLSRALKQAAIVHAPTSQAVIDVFQREKADVAAGVKQQLQQFAAADPTLRLLPGRFMAIEQAMGIPKGRDAGLSYVRAFVEEMKRSGFVAEALARSGQRDAAVAPPTTQ
jgi:polar amino acid transport system substrate-binding protein